MSEKILVAGRELDALVAEKVMGWTRWSDPEFRDGRMHFRDIKTSTLYLPEQWCPSESLMAAWQVVEKLGNWHGFDFMIIKPQLQMQYEAGWYEPSHEGPESRCTAQAETVPLAICLAAIETTGIG